jgi:hypothetical protein
VKRCPQTHPAILEFHIIGTAPGYHCIDQYHMWRNSEEYEKCNELHDAGKELLKNNNGVRVVRMRVLLCRE